MALLKLVNFILCKWYLNKADPKKKEWCYLTNSCEVLRAGLWIKEALRSPWGWTSPHLPNYAAESLEQDGYKLWESWAQVSRQRLSMTPAEISLVSLPHPLSAEKHGWCLGLAVTVNQFKYWTYSKQRGNYSPVTSWGYLNPDDGKLTICLTPHPEILVQIFSSFTAEGQPNKTYNWNA